jgi:adenosylmethionine-8-amino-7-oxononanoate aminotransferase
MNLRIQELKKQAMVEVRSHGAFGEVECYKTLDEDKFAELIVRECARIVINNGIATATHDQMVRQDCVNDIKEHFGVES